MDTIRRKYRDGEIVFINVNNSYTRPARVMKYEAGLYTLRFFIGGAIRLREGRIFFTEEEAKARLPKKMEPVRGNRNPHMFEQIKK